MILIENLDTIGTFDDDDHVEKQGSILIDGPVIKAVGTFTRSDLQPDEVINGEGMVAVPGFVNTHHHFFQQLTRAVPAVHSTNILDWLLHLYPIWGKMDEEAMYYATLLSCAELLLTGCTTTADMAYFYPFGRTNLIDIEIQAASELGIRFHPCRASMPGMEGDLSRKLAGQGVPVDQLIESQASILGESERVIQKYHDPDRFSMCRVAVGQSDKTYRHPEFMRQMAELARKYGVMLHTHLHPRQDEIQLCRDLYNQEPIDFLEDVGWLGEDVWFAHATSFTSEYVRRIAHSGTGISHSPSSNMRLSYPFAPVPELVDAGAKVSVAVDGGASNDSGNYLGELREVLLVHRIKGLHPAPYGNENATNPYDILRMGTRGGASVLNRNDIGSIEVGKAADIALFNLDRLDFAGTHDPLAALLLCGSCHYADTTIVNGRILVRGGRLTHMDESEIINGANRSAARLMADV